MPLPIRPLSEPSSGEPAESKLPSPPAPVDESSALPSLDFGDPVEEEAEEGLPGLPALEDDLYSGGLPPMEETSNPPRDFSLEDLPPLPEEELSDDEFDDLFNDFEDTEATPNPPPAAPPAPPALPEPTSVDDDEFEDMDFDSLFDEEEEDTQAPLPPASIEEPPGAENDEDDWGFDDLEDSSERPKDEKFDDSLFEEEDTSALPAVENAEDEIESNDSEDSWDNEFDKFMEEDDESEPEASENEDEEIPEDALAPLKKEGKGKKKPKGRGKSKGGAKAQNPILRSLAAIPILGLLFKPLLKLGSIGVAILGLIPLLIIPLVIFLIASNSVPGGNSIVGPDNAAASVADFSISGDKATATVTNSGEVVADVTTTFTVWSYNPFGGGSIFAFDEVGSCTADEVSVDIDASVTVTATCEPPAGGLMTKLSGSISY